TETGVGGGLMAIDLRSFTPARVALGLTGHSLPTAELLRFQLDHARARDAVTQQLDPSAISYEHPLLSIASPDRATYFRRPALGARLVVVLIGERPGLSSPDSLGIYLTWDPRRGRTDAERNCISNVRTEGNSYPAAAQKVFFLMSEARIRGLSGVALKEDARL